MPSYLPLVDAYERFLASDPTGDLRAFGAYLSTESEHGADAGEADGGTLAPHVQDYFDANREAYGYSTSDPEASYLIYRLAKFLRRYTKPVLAELGLASQDEFSMLAYLDHEGETAKRQLAEANLIDVSTGVDAVRRLLKRGLLAERANEADRRERLVSLTPAGKALLARAYRSFASVPDLLVGIDPPGAERLVRTLKRLDAEHTRRLGEP